jgi:hypothetical protein
MTTVMPIDEPRPRGTVLGERTDGRRVPEAEHFFRCKACNGWIDARDLVLRITKPRCRTRRKIKLNRLRGRLARFSRSGHYLVVCSP